APLYLMLRDEIRKSDDISQTKLFKNIEYLKTFGVSFNYAVILLGAFFGFRKFYDNYYDVLNLRFYKSYKAQQKEIDTEVNQEQVKTDLEKNIGGKVEEEKLTKNSEEENQIEEQTFENQVEEPKQTKITSNVQSALQNNKENKSDISSQFQK